MCPMIVRSWASGSGSSAGGEKTVDELGLVGWLVLCRLETDSCGEIGREETGERDPAGCSELWPLRRLVDSGIREEFEFRMR